MFTGIVQQTSEITKFQKKGQSVEICVLLEDLVQQVEKGDSIMIDGVCLTATELFDKEASFDVSSETVRMTTLKALSSGKHVNVELAMRPSDRFGGHFVSGHVDGTGVVSGIADNPGEVRMRLSVSKALTEQMIYKGSVALNGISLTISGLGDDWFEVSLIPHTMKATTLPSMTPGDEVNIECDMIGKWVYKLIHAHPDQMIHQKQNGLTMENLRKIM